MFGVVDGEVGGEEGAQALAVGAEAEGGRGVLDEELGRGRGEVVDDLGGEGEGEEVAC